MARRRRRRKRLFTTDIARSTRTPYAFIEKLYEVERNKLTRLRRGLTRLLKQEQFLRNCILALSEGRHARRPISEGYRFGRAALKCSRRNVSLDIKWQRRDIEEVERIVNHLKKVGILLAIAKKACRRK